MTKNWLYYHGQRRTIRAIYEIYRVDPGER